MPRLFTGLEIPQETARHLAEMRGGVFGARWIEPVDYHVTLRFIGDVDARTADDIVETLDEVRPRPVRIVFEGLNWFGGDRPRAIVAKVKSDPALMDLQSSQERRMRRIGLAPETRNFTPHVTLARLRSASPLALADYLGSRAGLQAAAFKPERFVLYSSRDSVGGGPYRVEASYPLG
jgi:RNA 2',3'-cyclic 3'-phosphodiesterase